jgi:F-type H+-transporting ATPase subunit b
VLKIDWTLLVQVINFFILLGLLQWLLFRPLRNIMDQRQDEIKGSLNQVRDLEKDIQDKQAAYAERLETVREEARQQREVMRRSVAAEQAELSAAAQREVAASRHELKKRIGAEQKEAAAVLKAEAERLAQAITRKIAGRSL